MTQLSFGILTVHNVPFNRLKEDWLYLESLGFESVWLGDHFAVPHAPTMPLFETWTTPAALATHTSRIRVGTLVTNVSWRHPAMVAKQAITVDHLSHGRLELGLGAGYYAQEYHWLGVARSGLVERAERFRETVQVIDGLLRNNVFTYQGQHARVSEAPVYPRPLQAPRPPLTLAAQGPKGLRLVAEYADRWVVLGERGASEARSMAMIRYRNEQLNAHCQEVGRDPGEISRALLVGFAGETPFLSMDVFHDLVGRYREIGIDTLIFYMWNEELATNDAYASMKGGAMADRESLERIGTEVIQKARL